MLNICSFNKHVNKLKEYLSCFTISFNKHVNKLKEYLSCFTISFNIIILTETWLTENYFVQIYFEHYSFSSSIEFVI